MSFCVTNRAYNSFLLIVDHLLKELKSQWLDKCSIAFGPKKNNVFTLKYDIPFLDAEKDVIILEAESKTDTSMQTFPASFRLQREKSQMKDKMHIIGYPKLHGAEQIIDPQCEVILSTTSKQKAKETMEEAVNWFGEKFKNDQKNFEVEYRNVLSHVDSTSTSVLFHCSKSIAHGASGGPGIVDLTNPVVQVMLLAGCPGFTYNPNVNGAFYKGIEIPLPYLFERGITMTSVHDMLSCKQELRNELFYNVKN